MKFVIAPDKFKDSLTGLEFCNAVSEGILSILTHAEIVKLPLADGGDGTIEVVDFYLKGKHVHVEVTNPLFKKIDAPYLFSEANQVAFIEMAEASGMKLLNNKERDCKSTTTIGTGELILDAINKGAKTIILGIGGSATNDCGIGMATALGYRFLNKEGIKVKPIGENLSNIVSIDSSQVEARLKHVNFKIASDVTNPLYGKNGAAYVYAEQKGATLEDIAMLDKGLEDFSKVIDAHFNINSQNIKGAGAAGGMGIATYVFLNGTLTSGIELIKEIARFDENIKNADWIITGEGKLDSQTLSGKTITGVLDSAIKESIPVAVFCGKIENESLDKLGITYADSVMRVANNLDDAMRNSYKYLKEISIKFSDKIKKV